MKIAAAPISWGVSEVPGWGHQLPPSTVLQEMAALGIEATEFGPDGFLPDDPSEKAATLAKYGLRAVGGFVPVVLHDPSIDPVPEAQEALEALVAAGADSLVLAAATGSDGYDSRPDLDESGWATLFANLDRLAELAAAAGITASLHPHMGTMIQTEDEIIRAMEGSTIPLTLDTGHIMAGGGDPVRLAERYAERIAHVHVKDVDASKAKKVQNGATTFYNAVVDGMFVPLGLGDVDFAAIVSALNRVGFRGWYVMEQDTVLPSPDAASGPSRDVQRSIEYLAALA
ncbi:MAG: TIM barrel protein [Bifidobacteriaceae bacterium]|jgi:inosose dehydratase|nr:TIM barrel protein [Bifidobacteriaceae bacterium]